MPDPRIRDGQFTRRRWIRWLCALALLMGSPAGHSRLWADGDADFSPVALEPGRGYFSQLPFEHVDMVNGNLLFTFPTVMLKGNAGMDLRLEWSYNDATRRWRYGLAGVPAYINHPDGQWPGEETDDCPCLVSYDDASRRAWRESEGSDTYWTAEFWKYTRSTRTLELPNGWVATYAQYDSLSVAMLQEIHDPFGNQITPHYDSPPPGFGPGLKLVSVDQTVGSDTRTVVLAYDGTRVTSPLCQ